LKEQQIEPPRPSDVVLDAAVFARHLSDVLAARNQETVWSLTRRFFKFLGFRHIIYGYSPDSHGPNLGAPEDYLVLTTLAPEASEELVEKSYHLQATSFHWALRNVGVIGWSSTAEECGVPEDFATSPEAVEFSFRNNLLAGCAIGFPKERTRGNAAMALIAPKGRTNDDVDLILGKHRDAVFVAAAIAHRCLSALPYPSARGDLTVRQREVLEWVAEGKTSADIATIMGLSAPTVDKHLRLARETLGVETTAHALIKAAFLNQVFSNRVPDKGAATASNPLNRPDN